MAFKTWASGDTLTAADIMTYLMKQVVITCTSGTRPASPVEGMVIYESDTDLLLIYTGAAYVELARTSASTVYAPTWSGFTAGNATTDITYVTTGKNIRYRGTVVLGTTSSVTGTLKVSLPVAGRTLTALGRQVGTASYEDVGVQMYGGFCSVVSASSNLEFHHLAAGNLGHVNATNPLTFGTGDIIYWSILYETA